MSEELKSCPFCGSVARIDVSDFGSAMVYCTAEELAVDCPVNPETGFHDNVAAAIAAWNTRPLESANEERIKALEEALRGVIDVGKPARGMFELWSEWDLRVRAYDKARAALAEEKKP